jgi:tetratricopeptide (TPR) repeat protein
LQRGIVYHTARLDYDRAIADYSDAVRLDPKFAAAFYNRGLAYQFGKQDFDRAITDYTEAIGLDPKHARALYNRGVAKQKIGDVAGGDADIASARALDPNVGK